MAKCEIMNHDEVEEIVYNYDSFTNVVGKPSEVEFIDGSFGTVTWLDSGGEEIEVCGYEHKKPIDRIVVKEGKIMKKNRMTERFNAPKDWNFEDMVNDYGMEYLSEEDSDHEPLNMDDFNEYMNDAWEAVRSAFYGGRYGYKNDSFNPNDPYFIFNGYGNVQSIAYIEDYLTDMIDEEEFYNWCVDNGYFESDEE